MENQQPPNFLPQSQPADQPQQMSTLEKMIIKEQVTEQIRTVFDPEIPVNIFELGLVYDVTVNDRGLVDITMTLTSPACPAAQSIPVEVKQKSELVKGVTEANVNIVWEPRWDMSMMTEEARLTLGM
ncbi:MAG: iron-sulfur cluster assembly protein [Bacteroidota bacterium]